MAMTEPRDSTLDRELSGLDALELGVAPPRSRARRLWASAWPKLAAVVLGIAVWQLVVWSAWKPEYALAGPGEVFGVLWDRMTDGTLLTAAGITMRRALIGFALAAVIGLLVGSVVSQFRVVRLAVGSLITGLQTMPSIAWFPLAILLFQLSEQAILFVVVLGAAPAVANGLINGTDHVPPLLVRAGRVLGANRLQLYRHVMLPACLPSVVGGLKQGWAFAWRSLMAGELLVIIPNAQSIGVQLQVSRDLSDAAGLMAAMIVILVIGVVVDSLLFGTVERAVRRRWGLVDAAAT
jgi:NitT/TauT family transport system permease protein